MKKITALLASLALLFAAAGCTSNTGYSDDSTAAHAAENSSSAVTAEKQTPENNKAGDAPATPDEKRSRKSSIAKHIHEHLILDESIMAMLY